MKRIEKMGGTEQTKKMVRATDEKDREDGGLDRDAARDGDSGMGDGASGMGGWVWDRWGDGSSGMGDGGLEKMRVRGWRWRVRERRSRPVALATDALRSNGRCEMEATDQGCKDLAWSRGLALVASGCDGGETRRGQRGMGRTTTNEGEIEVDEMREMKAMRAANEGDEFKVGEREKERGFAGRQKMKGQNERFRLQRL